MTLAELFGQYYNGELTNEEDRIQKYIDSITNDEYDIVIQDLCENYYDINYKLPRDIFEKEYMNTNSIDTANQIMKDYRDLFLI